MQLAACDKDANFVVPPAITRRHQATSHWVWWCVLFLQVHSMALIDPVCCCMWSGHLISNFVYNPARSTTGKQENQQRLLHVRLAAAALLLGQVFHRAPRQGWLQVHR